MLMTSFRAFLPIEEAFENFLETIRFKTYQDFQFSDLYKYYLMSKSTISTAAAISNSMIGTTLILFPITFNQSGIIANSLVIVIMAAILALTCKLLVSHVQPQEADVSASIRRKLGPAFGTLFAILCAVEVFLVSSVYFLLASDLGYCALDSIFGGIPMGDKTFRIILLGIFTLLNYLPNLKYVLKATPLAMGCLVLSVLVLIFSIPANIDNITIDFLKVKHLSMKQIFAVAAMNGFAFIVHPTVTSTIKAHKNPKQNSKAVYYGFGISTLLYISVGVLGAMSIYGRVPVQDKASYNIIDYYSGSFQAPLIGALTVAYLFMISPIFPFVAKNQITKLIPENRRSKISNLGIKASLVYSLLWVPCNLVFVLWEVSPALVINFISTVTAYFIAYLMPVMMTLKAGNYVFQSIKNVDSLQSSLISNNDEIRLSGGSQKDQQKSEATREDSERRLSLNSQEKSEEQVDPELLEDPALKTTPFERVLYGIILGFGTVMFLSELFFFVV